MKKNVVLYTLGGTIAYVRDRESLTGEDLLEAVPGLDPNIHVTIRPFYQKASSSLTIQDIIEVARDIQALDETELDGIVLTQGTDTIEESAFILDLLVKKEVPVVVTGAMRNPMQAGADGPANLLAAIQVAVSSKARGIGTVVVFNDEIHSPLFVRKAHTQNVGAFESDFGRLGWLSEGKPRLMLTPAWSYPDLTLEKIADVDTSVALVAVSMDDDDRLLKQMLDLDYQAIVIEGLGGGHVPAALSETLVSLAKRIPVVLASRTGRGEILQDTYKGYEGSETYLLGNGLMSAGWLDSRKVKLLLHLLLKAGRSFDEIRQELAYFHK